MPDRKCLICTENINQVHTVQLLVIFKDTVMLFPKGNTSSEALLLSLYL